jgi:hypothetical protein
MYLYSLQIKGDSNKQKIWVLNKYSVSIGHRVHERSALDLITNYKLSLQIAIYIYIHIYIYVCVCVCVSVCFIS